jgi:hypothetical protein
MPLRRWHREHKRTNRIIHKETNDGLEIDAIIVPIFLHNHKIETFFHYVMLITYKINLLA